MLAFYYVSWSIAIPESISELKLPFDEEYKIAEIMYKPFYWLPFKMFRKITNLVFLCS
jgi:hypothetical protein